MKTWEDILPSKYADNNYANEIDNRAKDLHNFAIDESIILLKQAEREGLVCINPPAREELIKIILTWWDKVDLPTGMSMSVLADVISSRLREGVKE